MVLDCVESGAEVHKEDSGDSRCKGGIEGVEEACHNVLCPLFGPV